MIDERLAADISRHIWATKYRYEDSQIHEHSVSDTWRRVARAIAAVEAKDVTTWEAHFLSILSDFKFLPGGRISAGAGTSRNVTLFNCFVLGTIEDSIPGIFQALQEAAVTMQQGGGIGVDFSTLRPRHTTVKGAGAIASGPVSFMQIWDAMCGTILSTGARRGAMMATLRCDHPDIEEFVTCKQLPGQLRRFNLSVLITDAFMTAVRRDLEWPLVFPSAGMDGHGETIWRRWSSADQPIQCRIVRRVRARELWALILRSAYDYAEPGVLFIDRINDQNNLWYREQICATNPCGEIPLPPYGACDLGSLNLTKFVQEPFTAKAAIDMDALRATTEVAVRFLDNVIDASRFPLSQHKENAVGSRRIGLGITGLADALIMLGATYGDGRSLTITRDLMKAICHTAYRASIAIAREKGRFPAFEQDKYLQSGFTRTLPKEIRSEIATHGMRNSHVIAIAPTGTISLLAGNVSSGLEPVFAPTYVRKILAEDGTPREFALVDYALDLWRQISRKSPTPAGFITVAELPVQAHLDMQAELQQFVDNSISKTINVPATCSFSEFQQVYELAYDKGLKGCTTFRPNPVTGTVLSDEASGVNAPHCCVLEREPD